MATDEIRTLDLNQLAFSFLNGQQQRNIYFGPRRAKCYEHAYSIQGGASSNRAEMAERPTRFSSWRIGRTSAVEMQEAAKNLRIDSHGQSEQGRFGRITRPEHSSQQRELQFQHSRGHVGGGITSELYSAGVPTEAQGAGNAFEGRLLPAPILSTRESRGAAAMNLDGIGRPVGAQADANVNEVMLPASILPARESRGAAAANLGGEGGQSYPAADGPMGRGELFKLVRPASAIVR